MSQSLTESFYGGESTPFKNGPAPSLSNSVMSSSMFGGIGPGSVQSTPLPAGSATRNGFQDINSTPIRVPARNPFNFLNHLPDHERQSQGSGHDLMTASCMELRDTHIDPMDRPIHGSHQMYQSMIGGSSSVGSNNTCGRASRPQSADRHGRTTEGPSSLPVVKEGHNENSVANRNKRTAQRLRRKTNDGSTPVRSRPGQSQSPPVSAGKCRTISVDHRRDSSENNDNSMATNDSDDITVKSSCYSMSESVSGADVVFDVRSTDTPPSTSSATTTTEAVATSSTSNTQCILDSGFDESMNGCEAAKSA